MISVDVFKIKFDTGYVSSITFENRQKSDKKQIIISRSKVS